jgi:hypothetical protein
MNGILMHLVLFRAELLVLRTDQKMQPHLWKTQHFPQRGPGAQKTEPIPAALQTFANNKSLPVRSKNFIFSDIPGSQVRQETKWFSSFGYLLWAMEVQQELLLVFDFPVVHTRRLVGLVLPQTRLLDVPLLG